MPKAHTFGGTQVRYFLKGILLTLNFKKLFLSSYDQHDIKAILNRAAELQQRSSGVDTISESNEHLTLSEI